MLQDAKTRRALQAYIASEWGAKLELTGDINHDIAQIQPVYDEALEAALILAPVTKGAISQKAAVRNTTRNL